MLHIGKMSFAYIGCTSKAGAESRVAGLSKSIPTRSRQD